MKIRLILVLIIILFFISSCDFNLEVGIEHKQVLTTIPTGKLSYTQTIISTPSPQPTLVPSPTLEPTPTVTLTSTPEGVIFRDDFSGNLQDGWTWNDEDPDRWTLTQDGWLQIIGQDESPLEGKMDNLICRPAPTGNYQISVHLFAEPWSDFQAAALFLLDDVDNYISINRGYCGPCLEGGGGFFVEYMMSGSIGVYKTPTSDPDVFLRLVNTGSSIEAYYALDEDDWIMLGSVGNFVKNPQVCLSVSNNDHTRSVDYNLIGKFDYIEFIQP